MKTETIHLRVSKAEKEKLEKMAIEQNCKVSEYLRSVSLQNLSQKQQQQFAQEIYAQLCEVADLINQIDDPTLRSKFKNWRRATWQSIR